MSAPPKQKTFRYVPDGKVIAEFFWDRSPVSIIQGPIGCLSAETEFLTPDGWRRMDHWSGEDVMVWRDGQAWFEPPLGYINKPCDQMWHFSNEHSLSMVLSDEHRMPLYDRHGAFRVRLASDVAAEPGRYTAPVTFGRAGGVPMDEARLRLNVAISADGCFPKRGDQVIVTVRKERKKERLRVLLAAAGMSWKEFPHSTRPAELTFAMPRLSWMSKRLNLWQADARALSVLIDELPHWDGLFEGEDCRYTSTVRENAEMVQFAAHATGRRATVSAHSDPRGKNWAPVFTVHITRPGSRKAAVGIRRGWMQIDRVPAPGGRKYCFTTSTGFFIARHNGRVFVTGNSGTSTACCMKMWAIACEQRPDPNGVRRSRWLIVRNTYNDLKETTLKTWRFWFEEIALGNMGEVKMTNPPSHEIQWPPAGKTLPDGSVVKAEFIFLALDQEEDVRKLLSMECTGVWFNEAQFTEKTVFNTAHSRAMQGRYPPKIMGGPTWKGVICDLNAPPEGHWIPYMRGDVPIPDEWDDDDRREYQRPDDWKFFVQPAGLIEIVKDGKVVGYEENNRETRLARGLKDPDAVAENTRHLTESYLALIKGKPKSWIDTYVMNRVGIYRAGRPVFESFQPEIHVAKERIAYLEGFPLIVGLDFARNPAAVMCQLVRGVMHVLDEFGMENVAAGTFAPRLKQRIQQKFPEAFRGGVQFWGDPTGGSKGQATDQTPFSIFKSNGMNVYPAPGNNSRSIRIEAVQSLLDRMVDGSPCLQIDQQCRVLKTGMAGGYHYAKIKGQHRYHEEPMKDRYSDYCDALQYACLGAGLGFAALNPGGEKPKPTKIERPRYSLRKHRRRA